MILLVITIVPISIISNLYANDIVSIVYSRGKFDNIANDLTSVALSYYSIGFVFIAIREVIIRGFYAVGDSKTPLKNGVISVGLSIILSIILTKYMGIGGIALASSIAAGVSSIILVYFIRKKIDQLKLSNYSATLVKIFIASFITLITAIVISSVLRDSSSIIRVVLASGISFGIYAGSLYLMKCKEFLFVLKGIKRKISH
jgi:putative peptidoglycan lipid II flippase